MRQNQFLKWFENIFENFEQDANRYKSDRQCISQKFPDNNPGLINRLDFIQDNHLKINYILPTCLKHIK